MAVYHYRTEVWVEYAVGTFVIFLRFYARSKIRSWHWDDYLMGVNLILWSAIAVIRHETSKVNNIKVGPNMPPKLLEGARLSRKLNFSGWILQVMFMWGLKACLCILYGRILRNLPVERYVKYVFWLVGITFIGAILVVCLHCLPVSDLWIAWPAPSKACYNGDWNFLIVGLLNVITELSLLALASAMLWQLGSLKVRLPLRKKLVIGFILCSGLITVLSSILRSVIGYLIEIQGSHGNFNNDAVKGWAARETFTALVIVNLPSLRPLISSKNWVSTPTNKSTERTGPTGGTGDSGNSSSGGGGTASALKSGFWKKYGGKTDIGVSTIGDTCYYEEEKANDVDVEAGHTAAHGPAIMTAAVTRQDVERSGITYVLPTPTDERREHVV